MAHNERIAKAITGDKKINVKRTTLSSRFKGERGIIKDVNSYVWQRLTQTQEESLITYINKLNNRGFSPTP